MPTVKYYWARNRKGSLTHTTADEPWRNHIKCQSLSQVWPLWPRGLQPTRLLCPWHFPGKNTGAGSHILLQGIFPRDWTCISCVFCIADRLLTCWVIREVSQTQKDKERVALSLWWAFPGGSDGKESVCHVGDSGSIPGSGRSREGNSYLLHYFCLENPMDRGAWKATIHGVAKSWIRLSS